MVAAILDGRKTQTRRVMKTQMPENFWRTGGIDTAGEYAYAVPLADEEKDDHLVNECKFPYGNIGDLLWVRETHYLFGHWRPLPGVKTPGGKQKWAFIQDSVEVLHDAPREYRKSMSRKDPETPAWHKRLARFMPRSASRITLEVTSVRVERLMDISEEDAKAEGAMVIDLGDGKDRYHHLVRGDAGYRLARESFRYLWMKINGPESWKADPWVWVIGFNVVESQSKAA